MKSIYWRALLLILKLSHLLVLCSAETIKEEEVEFCGRKEVGLDSLALDLKLLVRCSLDVLFRIN